jgi:DNA-binding NarL/FixJ family response regulator
VLDIADHALRADIADACEDADIAVARSPAPTLPSPGGQSGRAAAGREGEEADVVITDRAIVTAIPVIALASPDTHRVPVNVRAVVPADVDPATLAAIITVVAAGYALAPRKDLAAEGSGAWADSGVATDELAGALSPREREVLALVAEGASNKEIAGALALSVSTVKFHVAAITEKLGARSRVEAVAIAIRAGLVMV